jgi:hypothetical protein
VLALDGWRYNGMHARRDDTSAFPILALLFAIACTWRCIIDESPEPHRSGDAGIVFPWSGFGSYGTRQRTAG